MDNKKILLSLSKIGEQLLKNGTEIYRVEESIQRMALAYDFQNIEVFAIPSYLTISATKNDEIYNFTIRSKNNSINLDNIVLLNELVRYVCKNSPSNSYIEEKLFTIRNAKVNNVFIAVGYSLTALFFTIFYGGTYLDSIIGGIIGLSIYFTVYLLNKLKTNSLAVTLIASIQLALFSNIFDLLGFVDKLDSLIIGCLMVLVPGVAITNSLRDLIGGEFVSGLARITEAILVAVSLAMGVAIVLIAF